MKNYIYIYIDIDIYISQIIGEEGRRTGGQDRAFGGG